MVIMRLLDGNGNAAHQNFGPQQVNGVSRRTLWTTRARIYVIRINLRQSGVDRTQTASYTLR